MSETKSELNIVKLQTQEELEGVIRLHREVFSNNLTGQVGYRFIRFYFNRVLNSPNGIILICKDRQELIGFVIGLASKKGFQSLQYYCYICTLFNIKHKATSWSGRGW